MLGCTADSAEAAQYFFDEIEFGKSTRHLDYGDPDEFGRWAMESFATDHPADEGSSSRRPLGASPAPRT